MVKIEELLNYDQSGNKVNSYINVSEKVLGHAIQCGLNILNLLRVKNYIVYDVEGDRIFRLYFYNKMINDDSDGLVEFKLCLHYFEDGTFEYKLIRE